MKRLNLLIAAAAAPLAFAAAPAHAQGVPVVDPANIAQAARVVTNGVQQVNQLRAQVEQMTSMARTIGQNGPLAIATDMLKKAGLDFANSANSPLAPYRAALPGLLDALPNTQVGSALGVATNLAQQAKTNIQAGRQFALQAFYKAGNSTAAEVQQRQGVREAAMRDSVAAGYAMAVYTKNDLAQTETRMRALSEGVSAARDLRGDVQSNSAIALAQLQALTVQNQLLSQLLEVQSTASMVSPTTSTR